MPVIANKQEYLMESLPLDWPQSAGALLNQAKNGADLVKLITEGTTHIESWLIETRILPLLREHRLDILRFETVGQEIRSASLLALPDGTAFARDSEGYWSALAATDALHEIERIGSRFAPGDHWLNGFTARLQKAKGEDCLVSPLEVAKAWERTTGIWPAGFETGALDQMEAIGKGVAEKLLHTQSRLGI
jgi:hypothetical protein